MFHPASETTRRQAKVLIGVACVLCPLATIRWLIVAKGLSDFAAFRSFGVFVGSNDASLIYDPARLAPYQRGLHGVVLPYLYHPAMLLLVRPLAWMTPDAGRLVWSTASVVAFTASLVVGRREVSPLLGVAAIALPSTWLTIATGQNTLLMAALLIGGLRLLPVAPLLAGVLFGIATLKPQFGILVPVLLLGRGEWRAIGAASVTALCLSATSVAAYGTAAWGAWLHAPVGLGNVLPGPHDIHLAEMPTVWSMALQLGLGRQSAAALQAISFIGCAGVVWRRARASRGGHEETLAFDRLASTMLACSLLATPYAFAYDMPLLTGAVLIAIRRKALLGASFEPFEGPVLVACLLLPFLHLEGMVLPIAPMVMATFVWRLGVEHERAGGPATASV